MTFRIGMAGCGWISPYQIQGWNLVPGADVVAVCDLDASRAAAVGTEYRIGWIGEDAVRMIDQCKLDILDIATPPQSHKYLALEAMSRGLHVICQKPAALTLDDAQDMIDGAVRYGVTLYINEMLRFCPWFRQTSALLGSDSIGQPAFARFFSRTAGFLEVGPDRKVCYDFRDFLKSSDRVIILEETIHYLDVMRYLFGEPKTVYAATQRVSPLLRGEDVATIIVQYDGMTGVIEDSWSAHGPDRSGMEIEGPRGAIFLSHSRILELYSSLEGAIERRWDFSGRSWDEHRPRVFAALFQNFLEVIRSKKGLTAQARDNLKTLRLTLLAYESAQSGKAVRA